MRSVRARRTLAVLGRAVVETSGAQGISSTTCVERGKERRRAIKAPPAETLRAVANSRASLPFSSRLRTKTGMASGSRGHLRRSCSGCRRIKQFPRRVGLPVPLQHPRGQTGGLEAYFGGGTSFPLILQLQGRVRRIDCFAIYSPTRGRGDGGGKHRQMQGFCLQCQIVSFSVDSRIPLS
jgi:hypothetical protein